MSRAANSDSPTFRFNGNYGEPRTRPACDFKKGTTQFEIWHWFDEKLPNGIEELISA